FVVLFAIAYVLCNRIIGMNFGAGAAPFSSIAIGFATTAIVVVFWLQVPALSTIWHFGPAVSSVFAAQYAFWWLLGSYVVLAGLR
ncbi:MAG TPA: hypothetical protein VN495_03095, partial [Candidatus Paceibacterota bacterium]|nr:hypothetical protein [Candidatus Paceibacterota bacterium]